MGEFSHSLILPDHLRNTLLEEGLIDEIVVKLNPVVFGTGIPLFSGTSKQVALALGSSKIYENGVMLLNYQVKSW